MFQIVIVPKNTTANLALGYKTLAAAKKTELSIQTAMVGNQGFYFVTETDDYGYTINMRAEDICYCLFVDVFESQMLIFDKNMAIDKASQAIEKKLRTLGFSTNGTAPPSPIIRQ